MEKQAYVADKKAIIFDMMINLLLNKNIKLIYEKTHHPNYRILSKSKKKKR